MLQWKILLAQSVKEEVSGLVDHITCLQAKLLLKLAYDLAQLSLGCDFDVPSLPSVNLETRLNLVRNGRARLAHVHHGNCQVQESVLEVIKVKLLVFQQLKQLDGLQASDGSRRCGQSRYNLAGFELYCEPVHRWEAVVHGSHISAGVNEVYVEVLVIIFLELLNLKVSYGL